MSPWVLIQAGPKDSLLTLDACLVRFYYTRRPSLFFYSYTTMVLSGNRGQKAKLSPEQRSAIIHARKLGQLPSKLAQESFVSVAQYTTLAIASNTTKPWSLYLAVAGRSPSILWLYIRYIGLLAGILSEAIGSSDRKS